MFKWNLPTVSLALTYPYQAVLLLAVDGLSPVLLVGNFGCMVGAHCHHVTAPPVNSAIFSTEISVGILLTNRGCLLRSDNGGSLSCGQPTLPTKEPFESLGTLVALTVITEWML